MGVCLLIHGFTGSPYEVEPLADALRAQGHLVVTPTLAGHGGSRDQMMGVSWRDWIVSVEKVLLELIAEHQRVHIVGFSMGGLIAAYLAIQYRDHIQSLTMMSSPIYTINPKQLFRTIAEAIQVSMRSGGRQEDVARYLAKVKGTPVRSVRHFRRLVQTVKPLIEQIEVPLLVVQGEKDDLVEARSAAYIHDQARCSDKQLHFFSESRHMICHDCQADVVLSVVTEFIAGKESGDGYEQRDESITS